jgi:sulfoxide reductase catalytic subunit YedY
MLIKKHDDIRSSEITPEDSYYSRREFMRTASAAGIGLAAEVIIPVKLFGQERWPRGKKGPYDTDEEVNTFKEITTYNNFYEFGTDKSDPAEYSGSFKPGPWSVKIDGAVKKPANYHLEDLVKPYKLEDRIYRMRCVEGWSMARFPAGRSHQEGGADVQSEVRRIRDCLSPLRDARAATIRPAMALRRRPSDG